MHVDHAGTNLRQITFGFVRVGQIKIFGHRDAENGIPEKFEALVRGQTAVLVRVRAVRESQGQKTGLYIYADSGEELVVIALAAGG
jgi:hypothetical protein